MKEKGKIESERGKETLSIEWFPKEGFSALFCHCFQSICFTLLVYFQQLSIFEYLKPIDDCNLIRGQKTK